MSTNNPRAPFPFKYSFGEDDLACMDLRLMFVTRQWGALCAGIFLWVVALVACVIMIPLALVLGIFSGISSLVLKFRQVVADRLRPKAALRFNHRPDSDIAAMFCRYENELLCGKESTTERFALISRMAHIEKELEEYQVFCAAISRLRREEAMPNRRAAILHSRLRKKRRAEGKLESDGDDGEQK